jgi:hypothetical protein
MKNSVLVIILMLSSFTAFASDFDELSEKVYRDTGIRFNCVENEQHSRCHQILKDLLKYKNTLVKLRKDVPIFSVNIGQTTKTAGGDGVSVPYNHSAEDILMYLKMQEPISGATCLPPAPNMEIPQVWTCQGSCCNLCTVMFCCTWLRRRKSSS